MPLKPGHMLDQYQVIFLIGEGGMGEVYKQPLEVVANGPALLKQTSCGE